MSTRVVSFHYTLTDALGKVLDSSKGKEALSFMEGAQQIIPGLEKQLASLQEGDKKKIHVPAVEAYGVHEPEKIVAVPRAQLPTQSIKIGDRFSGGPEPHAPVFVVTKITETEAVLDGNHALAVRQATTEEMSHGHAHGVHGHSH